MKNVMNLAVVNFTCDWGDKEKNLERILGYCEEAGKRGMDLVVFLSARSRAMTPTSTTTGQRRCM